MDCFIIGGTGTISEGIVFEALKRNYSVTIVNRGNNNERVADNATLLHCDVNNTKEMNNILGDKVYDVIVDPITYNVDQLKQRVMLFRKHCKLYVFISSAAAIGNHEKIIDETTEKNPQWDYGKNKLKCEEYLKNMNANDFSFLIIRPSITYGDIRIPIPVACRENPWTVIERIKNNKPLICFEYKGIHETRHHLMNIRDFSKYVVELFDKDNALNNDYIVCSDIIHSWDDAYKTLYKVLGRTEHVYEVNREVFKFMDPTLYKDIIYDKDSYKAIFSNAKVKKDSGIQVKECSLKSGIEELTCYLEKFYSSRAIEEKYNEMTDSILLCGVKKRDSFLDEYLNGLDKRYKLKLRKIWYKRKIKHNLKKHWKNR